MWRPCGVHVASFGQRARWTLDQLYSSVRGDASNRCWNDEDRLVLGLADELHDTNSVSPGLWQQASERYSSEQLVELIMLAGLYHAVSFLVNACEVQHESFAPRFPRAAQPNTARIE
jgi:hypothetical protein